MINLTELPNEIIEKIGFNITDHKDYENFRMTCKYVMSVLPSCEYSFNNWNLCNNSRKFHLKNIAFGHILKNCLQDNEILLALKHMKIKNTIHGPTFRIKFLPNTVFNSELWAFLNELPRKLGIHSWSSKSFDFKLQFYTNRLWEMDYYFDENKLPILLENISRVEKEIIPKKNCFLCIMMIKLICDKFPNKNLNIHKYYDSLHLADLLIM